MHSTREGWLAEIVDGLRPTLERRTGKYLPEVRVSLGFPSGKRVFSTKGKTLGECWHTEAVSDEVHEIMISPTIGDDPDRIVSTLVHELCHVLAGVKNGHGRQFRRVCRLVGMGGKPTEAVPTGEMAAFCRWLAREAGPFPGGAITAPARKKQTTRMIKIGCDCGVIARASRSAIGQMSWICPVCQEEIQQQE